jgi:hypothetical protein
LRSTESSGVSAPAERGSVTSAAGAGIPAPEPKAKVDLADVPAPVQNTAKKLAGSATIQSITPKLESGALLYEVSFLQNGERKRILMNSEGVVQESKERSVK